MNKMNIEVTAKEYRSLLDILHIADVVMSGHRREEDVRTIPHRALIQKFYSYARAEFERLVDYDKNGKKYHLTAEFEDNSQAHALIDEFGDHLFWDHLISRLSARDAAHAAGGVERLNALSESDRQAMEVPIRQRYIEEFSLHGVANLDVVEKFSYGEGRPIKTSD
jgi:hypothetical protein